MASVLDNLRATLADINKAAAKAGFDIKKTPIIQSGVPEDRFLDTFSLGSPLLDYLVYNAVPKGIWIEISGPESSGKTTLSFAMAADYIRKEKKAFKEQQEKNKEIQECYEKKCEAAKAAGKKLPEAPVLEDYVIRPILFVDAEGTLNPRWARVIGYDTNVMGVEDAEEAITSSVDADGNPVVKTLYFTPMGQTAEQIFEVVGSLVKTGAIGFVIFDSLVSIAAQQAMNKTMEEKTMGGVSGPIGDFVKRYTGVFNRYRTTFIGLNGIYMDPSGYGNPEKTPGGTYWKRACSLRLKVKKGKSFDAEGKELKETAAGVVGHEIEVALLKTKFCRWDRRLATLKLDYTKGFDIISDTITLAILFNIIQEPSPNYYIVVDPDTGEALSNKIHGDKNIKPFLEEHLDIAKRLYDLVYQKLADQEAPNVRTFEEMLNIDVEKLFDIDFEKEANDNIDEECSI